MSLFPGKLKPGGTVTIHLRVTAKFPVWVEKKVFVEDPSGNRTPCMDRLQPFLPVHFDPQEFQLIKESGTPFQATPILMAAHYLSNEKKNVDYFIKTLLALRDATHLYTTYKLPQDAPLGRYWIRLESYYNGEMAGSGTGDTDYFLVEDLKLVERTGSEALVENPSPEVVVAQLCDTSPPIRLLSLPPKSVTKIPVRSPAAFLLFAGGAEFLRLGAEGDPFCVRNQTLRALVRPDGSTLVGDTRASETRGHQLDSLGSEIWKLADGLATRSMIRNEQNATTYDEMIEHGLIHEVN